MQFKQENIVEEAKGSGFPGRQRRRRQEFGTTSVVDSRAMTVQQLNAKRDEIVRKEIEKVQLESKMMMDRYKQECQRRDDLLQQEEEMRAQEERKKQQLLEERMMEQEKKMKARKEELRRQEALLTQQHVKAEQEAKRREEEAKLQEERRLAVQREKQKQENRAEALQLKAEERKILDAQREKERKVEEDIRRREMERLQNMMSKEQEIMMKRQAELNNMSNTDLKFKTPSECRPGLLRGFGFGNVRTGQVSSRKFSFLARASSAGPEERAGLNPQTMGSNDRSASTRASPMPSSNDPRSHSLNGNANMQLHQSPITGKWAQQSGAIGKTDFASSTKALGAGLTRRSGTKA